MADPHGRTVATLLTRDDGVQVVSHGVEANDTEAETYVLWVSTGAPRRRWGALRTSLVRPAALTPWRSRAPSHFPGYGISIEPGRTAPEAPTDVVAGLAAQRTARDDPHMPRLLVVHHTPSPALQAVLEAVKEGVALAEGTELGAAAGVSAGPADVLAADGVLLGTPANIGYMSGALKHFFDTVYYPCLDATVGLSYGVYVHGNDDPAGCSAASPGSPAPCAGSRWPRR